MRFLFFFISLITWAQKSTSVDFTTLEAHLQLQPQTKSISGNVYYTFKVLSAIDTIRLDAKAMYFDQVKINGKPVKFSNDASHLKLFEGFKKGKNTLSFEYKATPKQTLYFIGEEDDFQIWTQGQGKYTSHWLPSFDDVNEKVIFNLTIDYEAGFEVLSNGILKNIKKNSTVTTWYYTMKHPMSSYLVMLAIGKYQKSTINSASGTSLEFYLPHNDSDKFETTYAYSKQMFDFLEKEIRVVYPWQVYRQVPVRDFLYAGMENTSSTTFAQDFVVDAIGFNDKTYVNVNAHELAHQWFGDLITASTSQHHWLQEGFATYYALLAEKELFGEDHFNWKLYEMAERLTKAKEETITPLLNEKASSLVFYQKGAWALHYLKNKVGAANFQKAVKNYLTKYAFKNVTTQDFLSEITKVSGYNTSEFQNVWLEKPGFETQEAIALLQQNTFMKQYFELVDWQGISFKDKKENFKKVLASSAYYPLKQEVIYQLDEVPYEDKKELLLLGMQSNEGKVRQAIARILIVIPEDFREAYESLLMDESYITNEIALNTLWRLFPDRQQEYLNVTKKYVGFNDKNLRILWLTLALMTKDFELDNKVMYYDELLSYASAKYESSIRQNAINYLLYLNPNDTNIFKPLVNAATHHKWQFTLFARNQIKALLKSEKHRAYFLTLLPNLSAAEQIQLQKLLGN